MEQINDQQFKVLEALFSNTIYQKDGNDNLVLHFQNINNHKTNKSVSIYLHVNNEGTTVRNFKYNIPYSFISIFNDSLKNDNVNINYMDKDNLDNKLSFSHAYDNKYIIDYDNQNEFGDKLFLKV